MSNKKNLVLNYKKPCHETIDFTIKEDDRLKDLRLAAEYHRTIRKELVKIMKPGMFIFDLCKFIENRVEELFGSKYSYGKGFAFPIGMSVNNIVCHDSAHSENDKRVITKNDVIKIDIGIHIKGNIVDSAFTHTFDKKYDNLVKATKEATWTGIKASGPDARLREISKEIQETIESHEIELNGQTYPIKSIYGIGGHKIDKGIVHKGGLILSRCDYPEGMEDEKMQIGDQFAIETYASTGDGNVRQSSDLEFTHFGLNEEAPEVKSFTLKSTPVVLSWISKNRKLLPFANRWLEEDLKDKLGNKYKMGLSELVKREIVIAYPALCDKVGTFTSQNEHTIYIHDYGKEVITHGPDY